MTRSYLGEGPSATSHPQRTERKGKYKKLLCANYTAWKQRLEKKNHDLVPELAAYALTRSFSYTSHQCGHDSLADNTYWDRNGAPSSTAGSQAHAHAHASCLLSVPSHRFFRRGSWVVAVLQPTCDRIIQRLEVKNRFVSKHSVCLE